MQELPAGEHAPCLTVRQPAGGDVLGDPTAMSLNGHALVDEGNRPAARRDRVLNYEPLQRAGL